MHPPSLWDVCVTLLPCQIDANTIHITHDREWALGNHEDGYLIGLCLCPSRSPLTLAQVLRI